MLLLLVFCLPFVAAYGADGGVDLPACCRRNGKHMCAGMRMTEQERESGDAAFARVSERCPFRAAVVVSTHASGLAGPWDEALRMGFPSDAFGVAQSESKRRISRDRARGKRGPPVELFS